MTEKLDLLPEDPREREMFDYLVKTLFEGEPVSAVIFSLRTLALSLPPQGSFCQQLNIYSNELCKMRAEEETKVDVTDIGSGRTTGLMLKALGEAVLAKGEEVEFVDHDTAAIPSFAPVIAEKHSVAIRSMANQLGLLVETRWTNDGNVFVRSLHYPVAPPR